MQALDSLVFRYIKPMNVQPFVTQNDDENENSVNPLSLAELIGVVLMLGIFIFLCIVVFVCERYLINGQRGNIEILVNSMKPEKFTTNVTPLETWPDNKYLP